MADITIYQDPLTRRNNPTLPENASDTLVVDMWLRSHRSSKTRETYRSDVIDLQTFTSGKPLQQLTLLDLLDFEASLE